MKEDYLWDKSGSDSEIEGLENSLKEFRSTNTTAPKLPKNTLAFDKVSLRNEKQRRFSFQLAFAAFACLGFTIISVGLFQALNTDEKDLAISEYRKVSDEPKVLKQTGVESSPTVNEIIKTETTQPEVAKAKFKQKPIAKRKVRAKRQVTTSKKRNPIIARKVKRKIKSEPKAKKVKLTKEEKEAYDKLMQALAITGSQMRIVQDGINGIKEKPSIKER